MMNTVGLLGNLSSYIPHRWMLACDNKSDSNNNDVLLSGYKDPIISQHTIQKQPLKSEKVSSISTSSLSIPLICNEDIGTTSLSSGSNKNSSEKYCLRPRSQRSRKIIEAEIPKRRLPKSASRPKPRPPPLSKYRRKTANARERNRMREINVAFETLRKAVPLHEQTAAPPIRPGQQNVGSCEKLTKITTLRSAMKYIRTLSDMLNGTTTNSQQSNNMNNISTSMASTSMNSTFLNSTFVGDSSNSSSGLFFDSQPSAPLLGLLTGSEGLNGARTLLTSVGEGTDSGSPGPSEFDDFFSDDDVCQLDSLDDLLGVADVGVGMSDVNAPFDIWLESDGDSLTFSSDLSDQPTP